MKLFFLFLLRLTEIDLAFIQVAENVIDYQVDRYSRTKGIDPESITTEQRVSLMDEMIRENYPGNTLINFVGKLNQEAYFFSGLETSPITLTETMMPNISPEMAVDAAVKIFGGYDPSLFAVSINSARKFFLFDRPNLITQYFHSSIQNSLNS